MPEQVAARKPGKKTLAGVVGVAAAGLLYTMIPAHEGVVHHGYRDPVGIPTKCMGDTHNVVVGRRYTNAECQASMEQQLIAHAEPVLRCTPALRGHPYELAASVDLAYNIGGAGWCKSRSSALFNAGKFPDACSALGVYVYARGRKLPGLVTRRADEVYFCLYHRPRPGSVG